MIALDFNYCVAFPVEVHTDPPRKNQILNRTQRND